MSSNSTPIPPARFAAALRDLPLSSLHAKAAELRNSIAHLLSSNEELKPYAEAGDKDCAEAITENEEVMRRMEERILLLRREVEGRGMRWVEEGGEQEKGQGEGGVGEEDLVMGDADGDVEVGGERGEQAVAGGLGERMELGDGEQEGGTEEEGLHL